MTCRAILAGSIARSPVEKIGKSGKPFAILSVRETGVEPAQWFSVILFGDAVPNALRLNVGDPIALAGSPDAEVYTPEGGEPRVSWKFTADAVLTARKAAKSEGRS
jgi:Single-strand binding protein family